MTYQEAREFLDRTAKKGIVLGLTVMEGLLKRLGDPQKQLKIVHIAGTNGKGSILAYLEEIFLTAGYRTGRYVSPVIGEYEERFLLSALPVEKERIPVLVNQVREAAIRLEKETGLVPTVFELETAMAFLAFLEEQVDVVLLETGMGGRLDATNVIEPPLLSIIASVSEDHMPVLGENLTEIAKEKAGIIKEGSRVLLYPVQEAEVREVFQCVCKEKQVPLTEIDEKEIIIIEETPDGNRFSFGECKDFEVFLPGKHQIYNAATALCAANILKEQYPLLNNIECQKKGLARTRWEGRLEKICDRPAVYLDGAHNKDAAKRLADFVKKHFKGRRILAVTGVLADKEYEKMMSLVLPMMDKTAVFTPDNKRGLPGEVLCKTAEKYCNDCVLFPRVRDAVSWALGEASEEDVIIIFGSLSFIVELGEYHGKISKDYRA